MKKPLYEFHDIRNASLDTGGRDDIPRLRRARGGKIEMRSAGGADVDRDQPRRSKHRATGERGEPKSKLSVVSGAQPKRRADRAPRRKQKFADGGAPYAASATPYGGVVSYVPAVQIAPGHFTPPAIPAQPDLTAQIMSAGIANFGKNLGTNNENNSNPVDLGYAIYSNGTPIGIKGIAPFAGGPQDISVGSKRGGRIERRNGRKR